jgi:general secretion pathway protein A
VVRCSPLTLAQDTLQRSPYLRFFSFFNLRENPFAGSPDPRYLFATRRIQEAWEAITYGIESREGIIVLTGEAGTGKTSILHRLIGWLSERRQPATFIFNPHLEPKHLYDFMLADFGVRPDPRWQGNTLMRLEHWLAERSREDRTPVLIVDEAQGLPLHVLEEIRLLLNLETPQRKLLQIILAGQPDLEATLNRPDLRHLKQRIALHCRTALLTDKETRDYLRARLDTAGAAGKAIFSPEAVAAVHAYSGGIPRVMNLLCEHALINAYSANLRVVPVRVVTEIAWEFHLDLREHVPTVPSAVFDNQSQRPEEPAHREVPLPMIQEAPTVRSPAEPQRVKPVSVPPAPAFADVPAQERVSAVHQAIEAAQDNALAFNDPVPALISTTSSRPRSGDEISTASSEGQERDSGVVVLKLRGKQLLKTQFGGVRLEAIEKSKAIRAKLQSAWLHATDKQRWQRFGASVARRIEPSVQNVQRLSKAASNFKSALQIRLRQSWPAWERVKGSLLIWLKRPLPLPHRWLGSKILAARKMPSEVFASAFIERRTARRTRERFQVVTLSAQRQDVNVAVLRWLREPFRPSRALPVPRATVSRNRLNSV